MPYVPYPLDRGTFHRVFNLTKGLGAHAKIDLFCLNDNPQAELQRPVFEPFCNRIRFSPFQHPVWPSMLKGRLMRKLPTTITHWECEWAMKDLKAFVKGHTYDRILCFDIVLWPYVQAAFPKHPYCIVDRSRVDLLFQNEELNVLSQSFRQRLMRRENIWKLKSFEKQVIRDCFSMIVCGADDQRFLTQTLGPTKKIQVIPNGVDAYTFNEAAFPPTPTATPTAIFCGALDYTPNVDGLIWYASEVHPKIRAQSPSYTLKIVGKNPLPIIKRLAEFTPGIELVGEVSDVRPHYQNAWFQIVPLRIGGGTRLKIVECLAMGIPVLSTTLGAQGLNLVDGQDLLMADSIDDFAEDALLYIQDKPLRDAHAKSGQATVLKNYTWPILGKAFFNTLSTGQTDTHKTSTEPSVSLLLGLPFHEISMGEALEACKHTLEAKTPQYFVTANVDFAAQAYKNEALRTILFHAKRVLCDGMPLVWVSKLLGGSINERVTGADLVPRLLALCAEAKQNVYFFGSDLNTLTQAKTILENRYKDLRIVGVEAPKIGTIDSWDNDRIITNIRQAKTDLLLVALGCPKQELWISQFHKATQASLSIGIGASLDFIAGKQIRAPKLFQSIGMEWLWRMLSNPRRLMGRYLRDSLFLFWVTFKQYQAMKHMAQTPILTSKREERKLTRIFPTGLAATPSNTPTPTSDPIELSWQGRVERSNITTLDVPTTFTGPIILELSAVTFIDSSGLGLLAKIARQAKNAHVPFCLLSPSNVVSRSIAAIRLEKELPSFPDRATLYQYLELPSPVLL